MPSIETRFRFLGEITKVPEGASASKEKFLTPTHLSPSIAESDADGASRAHQFAFRIYGLEMADGVGHVY